MVGVTSVGAQVKNQRFPIGKRNSVRQSETLGPRINLFRIGQLMVLGPLLVALGRGQHRVDECHAAHPIGNAREVQIAGIGRFAL